MKSTPREVLTTRVYLVLQFLEETWSSNFLLPVLVQIGEGVSLIDGTAPGSTNITAATGKDHFLKS